MGPLHSKLLIEFDSEMWRQRQIHPRHHGPIRPPDLLPFYPSSVLHHWGPHTRAVPWSHAQGVVSLVDVFLRRMYQGQWLCLGDEIRHRALSAETYSLCVVQVWNQKKRWFMTRHIGSFGLLTSGGCEVKVESFKCVYQALGRQWRYFLFREFEFIFLAAPFKNICSYFLNC